MVAALQASSSPRENILAYDACASGAYQDAESGLHQNRYRYYSPELGRYISADPIGQLGGVNVFAYVGNRPTVSIDPLGLAARIVCERCKGDPQGSMSCSACDDFGNCFSFTANTGRNYPGFTGHSESAAATDIYGPNGPLPPDTQYSVVPRGTPGKGARYPAGTPSVTQPGQSPGSLTTAAGTQRTDVFFHGPGTTLGCFACNDDGSALVKDMMDRNLGSGGTTVIINEVDCNSCDPTSPPQ